MAKNFLKITKEEKEKLLEALVNTPEIYLKAIVTTIVAILIEQKICTQEDLEKGVKLVKEKFKDQYAKDVKGLDLAVLLKKLTGAK